MTALATTDDVQAVIAQTLDAPALAFVSRLIEMVSASVVRYTSQSFELVEDDELVITPHDGVLRLPQLPVTEVASVTVGTTLIDPAIYEAKANGYIRLVSPHAIAADSQFGIWSHAWPLDGEWPWSPFPTTVVNTHGYPEGEMPADVAMVVAEVVAGKFLAGARRAEGTKSVSIDTYSESYGGVGEATLRGWTPEHKAILDSYRRSGFASVRIG